MNQNPTDSLDSLLREGDEHIADNGFSARVLAALPSRQRYVWLRMLIWVIATSVCVILICSHLDAITSMLTTLASNPQSVRFQTFAELIPLATIAAALMWGLFLTIGEEE